MEFLVLGILWFVSIVYSNNIALSYKVSEITELSYGQHIGSHTARSILDCFSICTKLETCISVTYSVTSHQCSLNQQTIADNVLSTLPSTPPLVKYGSKISSCVTTMRNSCGSNADCLDIDSWCNNGECRCNTGLSYAQGTCSCTFGCKNYGTTFQSMENVYIVNDNMTRFTGRTLPECLQLCIDETSFVCRIAEFFDSGECQVQKEDLNGLGILLNNQCVTYIRDCDIE